MRKKFIALCLGAFWLTALACPAQKSAEARHVLDATAETLQSRGDYKIVFTLTTYAGDTEQGSVSGTMCLKDKRFHLVTPEMQTWFDGKTQWTYVPANEEVNVSHPTQDELQALNPYAFIDIYKSGYDYSVAGGTVRGKKVHTVTLRATDSKAKIREMVIDIDQATRLPLHVRFREGKDWVRIAINGIDTHQRFPDSLFRFDRKSYPDAEVIDLR